MSRTKNQDITPFLQSLPQTLREPIEKLRDVQKQCDSIKVQYLKELKALEAKYKTFYDPVYDTRARIIRGVATTGFQSGFWLRVFLSSSPVGRTITKKDEEILRYLMDVRSSPLPNERSGFELMFQFAQNPYFTDSQLTKSYVLGDEEDGMLESSSGCQIHWNEGKNPKLKTIWRNGRQAITETESFFDFFQPVELPMGDVSEDLNFEQIHLVQESLEEDFEIGLVIKDSLIPNAVSWFTGELAEISSSSEDNDDDSSECSSNDQINTEEEE